MLGGDVGDFGQGRRMSGGFAEMIRGSSLDLCRKFEGARQEWGASRGECWRVWGRMGMVSIGSFRRQERASDGATVTGDLHL